MNRLRRGAHSYTSLWYAFLCAGSYCVFAVLWIHFSSELAGSYAASIEELERIEKYKGFGFQIFASIMFFAFSITAFRRMAAGADRLIQSQQRLVQAEREAITGLIVSSVAHDCANLLTILRLNTERLKTMPDMPLKSKEVVNKLDNGVVRLTELTSRLRSAGQNFLKNKPERYDLIATINETVGFLRVHQAVRDCDIEFTSEDSIEAVGYPILIHQLLMNLIINAAEATNGQGHIEIFARREGGAIEIEVHDNGPGILPLLRESIFDAFFTTKNFGTGLGLMSVKSCVDLHDGQIEVIDSPLGGACFKVSLHDINPERVALLQMAKGDAESIRDSSLN